MATLSNEAVGRLLDVSHAAVSRYKSGDRVPSTDVMRKVRDLFDWSLDEQDRARERGRYADEFNSRLDAYSALGALGEETAADQQVGSRQTAENAPTG